MTAVIGLVAALFQALGYTLYVRLFLRRVIRPNAASSFMFAYGTALLVLLEWKDGARWEILALPITCSLASIGVALLCLRKGATEPVDRIEATAFFADVWLTVLWAMIAFGYGNIAPFSTGFLEVAGNVTQLDLFLLAELPASARDEHRRAHGSARAASTPSSMVASQAPPARDRCRAAGLAPAPRAATGAGRWRSAELLAELRAHRLAVHVQAIPRSH